MMKEKARLTKVKGTVLFTVVSVMMVLIVFLMGTLALAATANNRANRNYQKEQTEATARAVLDAVVEAINQDDKKVGGLTDKIGNLSIGGADLTFNVTFDEGGTKKEYPVTITKMEERPFYEKDKWQTGNVYSVSTTIIMQSTGVETVYTAYMSDAEINDGKSVSGGGGGGGAFVSMGGLGVDMVGTSGFVAGGSTINLKGNDDPLDTIKLDQDTKFMAPVYIYGNYEQVVHSQVYFNKMAEHQYFAVEGNFISENGVEILYSDDFDWTDEASFNTIPFIYVGGVFTINNNIQLNTSGVTTNPQAVNVYCGSMNLLDETKNFEIMGDVYCFDDTATSYLYAKSNNTTTLYKWVKKTVKNSKGKEEDTEFGNLFSKGSLVLGRNVGGSVRVEDNLEISSFSKAENKNMDNREIVVGEDVIVGGTLTIDSNSTLRCKRIIANKIVNNGTIACSGDVMAVTYDEASNESTSQTLSSVTKVYKWYEDFKYDSYELVNVYVDNAGEEYESRRYQYKIHATYEEHTKTEVDGEETGHVHETKEYTNEWIQSNEQLNSLDQVAEKNTDANVKPMKETYTSEANAKVETTNSYESSDNPHKKISSVTVSYGDEIYPSCYTKANIKKDLVNPPDANKYKYPTTLKELNKTATILDADENLILPTATFTGGEDVITKSCIINTAKSTGTLYIRPDSSDALVIVVQGEIVMGTGVNIYIDDKTAPVYFFIDKGSSLKVSGARFMTELYRDNLYQESDFTINQKCTVTDWYYPNVYIYSGEHTTKDGKNYPRLELTEGAILTANIRAPEMTYVATATPEARKATMTYYDGVSNKDFASNEKLELYGQLIAGSISVSNEWGLIYVTTDNDPCTCGHCSGSPATCTCAEDGGCPTTGCSSCTCTNCPGKAGGMGGGTSSAAPDKLYTMYYNYY